MRISFVLIALNLLTGLALADTGPCETWQFSNEYETGRAVKLCKVSENTWEGTYVTPHHAKFQVEYTSRKRTLAVVTITSNATHYKAVFTGVYLNADGIFTIAGTGRDVDNNTFNFVMRKQ